MIMIILNISLNISMMENKEEVRAYLKMALENMYMFGGMPRPDPKYDSYLDGLIEMVMKVIEKNK